MVDTHKKKCPKSIAIGKTQTKPTVSSHSHPPEWLTVKRLTTSKAGEEVEQPDSHMYSVGASNGATSFGKVLAVAFNFIVVYLPSDPAIPCLDIYSIEIKHAHKNI